MKWVYVVAVSAALLVGTLALVWYFNVQRRRSSYERQLEELIEDHGEETKKARITPWSRWNEYWMRRFKGVGWARYNADNSHAGRDVLLFWVLVGLIAGLITRNIWAGVGISVALLVLIGSVMKSKENRDSDVLAAQLPGFLFALKANIQANETPERAILKVVDAMPSPLYEELSIVKEKILVNASFAEALEELSARTSSRDLKFLCACMIQASANGSNLENQITVIQKVLEARRKVADELAQAVRSSQGAIIVSSIVLPLTFIATLFMDENATQFWFHGMLSWILLAAVVLLYAAGVLLCRRMVNNIKNL